MAVSLPSDLIVDVMRAADPASVQLAAAKLKARARPEVAGTLFTDALQQLRQPKPSGDMISDVMRAAEPGAASAAARKLAGLSTTPNDAYAQFEAFMLRDAIEEMLPKTGSGAFGEGFAGGVWRSMAAEQFASIFTQHGGLGIAETMRSRAADVAPPPAADGQWPYYRGPAISAYMPPVA
jgi:peptidoglycan hydrolase FlgJ